MMKKCLHRVNIDGFVDEVKKETKEKNIFLTK